MQVQASLTTVDYVVAAIILLVPVAIGIWYAFRDANKATRAEYLLGGRQMSVVPVSLSMFITYQSAISLMGIPAEVYFYGSIYFMATIGIIISYMIGYFTVVPLMYPLQITSIYEYLELRYKSEAVRLIGTVVGMLSTVCYMAITLLSPALALEATVNIPLWMSIALFGAVGTLYTAIGGIKSVVWTDAFQTIIVFIGILAIIIKACIEVGGLEEVWQLSQAGERTRFDKFTPDPRVRHTLWSLPLGIGCLWLNNVFNQSTLQRISSMRSLRDAKLAFVLNVPLVLAFNAILCVTGLAIFAYYFFHNCDPKQGDLISNINQLAPYFVLHAMSDIPGLAGLFTSVLCCGALSTLSSGINALAAVTVEDLLQRPLRSLQESTITLITKVFVVLYGAGIIGLTYLTKSLSGPVGQMANTLVGAVSSPIVGVFLMGGAVPWANKFGAIAGAVVSFSFNVWVSVGNRLQGKSTQTLPSVGIEGCANWTEYSYDSASHVLSWPPANHLNLTSASPRYVLDADSKQPSSPSGETFFLYAISYEWYSLMGVIVCVVVSLGVSYITNRMWAGTGSDDDVLTPSEARYIFPFMRNFWGMENPEIPNHSDKSEDIRGVQKDIVSNSKRDIQMHPIYRGLPRI